jgi:hypothetical protein
MFIFLNLFCYSLKRLQLHMLMEILFYFKGIEPDISTFVLQITTVSTNCNWSQQLEGHIIWSE